MLELKIDRKRLNYNENLKCMAFGKSFIFMPFGNYAIWEVTYIYLICSTCLGLTSCTELNIMQAEIVLPHNFSVSDATLRSFEVKQL